MSLRKYKVQRYLFYFFEILSFILLAYVFYGGIYFLLSISMVYHFSRLDWAFWYLNFNVLLPGLLVMIFGKLSDMFKEMANETLEELKMEIAGMVNIYGGMSLSDLSRKIGAGIEETERFIGRLSAEGKFNGRIEGGFITIRPVESAEKPADISTQVMEDSKEKLAKLEQLYKEGKISESAYKKLKEEYERA